MSVNSCLKNFKSVKGSCLGTGNCCNTYITQLGHHFCCTGSIGSFFNSITMGSNKVSALFQRLRMTYNLLDCRQAGTLYAKQVLLYIQCINSVYKKRTLEHKICNLANFSGIGIFYRKNGVVTVSLFHCFISRTKISKGLQLLSRKNFAGRNMCKGPFNSAVCNFHKTSGWFLQSQPPQKKSGSTRKDRTAFCISCIFYILCFSTYTFSAIKVKGKK